MNAAGSEPRKPSRFARFFGGTLRISVALTIAGVALGLLALGYQAAQTQFQRLQTKPYETVKTMTDDLGSIGLKVTTRTKLYQERMYAIVVVDGYPDYLALPWNQYRHMTVQFLDRDGFKVYERDITPNEATTSVDDAGKPTGFYFEFATSMDVETYARIAKINAPYNFDTSKPQPPKAGEPVRVAPPAPSYPKHCASGLTNLQRQSYLYWLGSPQLTAPNRYEVAGHGLEFNADGTLVSCW